MKRAALVFPGRGSYTATSLGSLPPDHPLVQRVEALRSGYDLPPLVELDQAAQFDPKVHLLPANASPLIFLASLLDLGAAPDDVEPVVAVGNSMGWYTALTAVGALSLEDGYRLVQEMSLLQQEPLASERQQNAPELARAALVWQNFSASAKGTDRDRQRTSRHNVCSRRSTEFERARASPVLLRYRPASHIRDP